MSENWKVHLVYSDARSNKFWRARTDGSTMYINYGRIGSDGQTSVKEFGSAKDAQAALEKQANSKRKKGYVDQEGAAPEESTDTPITPPSEPQTVYMSLERDGRSIDVALTYDGQAVRTQVTETYNGVEDAAAAFVRIQQSLLTDGYKKKN